MTREVQSVDLPQVPNAASVRTDGLYAAVGHNAWVSYVNLAYRGAVTLPRFVAPGVGSFKSEGRFVFSTTSGQRVYLLVKAENASGLALDWGLVTYNLSELP